MAMMGVVGIVVEMMRVASGNGGCPQITFFCGLAVVEIALLKDYFFGGRWVWRRCVRPTLARHAAEKEKEKEVGPGRVLGVEDVVMRYHRARRYPAEIAKDLRLAEEEVERIRHQMDAARGFEEA